MQPSDIKLGSVVQLCKPVRPGPAMLVAIIGAGSKPNATDIDKWYGYNPPASVYQALRTSRYIFVRLDVVEIGKNPHVIIPEKLLSELTRQS